MTVPGGAEAVAMVAQTIARAVELVMDPSVPQDQRFEAYSTIESFKDKSPLCVQCGLYILDQPNISHTVRHFGLQLMEHCIKYRWYDLSQQEKIFIKESAMKLLSAGMDIQAPQHMKDALSRVVVEMIKREWPQQWPSLMSELSQVSSRGESQTQLVLLVFLRLVEDVALLQTLESNQRRRDIYQALTLNMGEIFNFLVQLIETHVTKFRDLQAQNRPIEELTPHAAVVQTVLLTLTGFVEWVSITHIMMDDGRLLRDLCLLLDQPHFQLGAAECLHQVVSRKGKVEERKPLLVLFSTEAMTCIYRSACVSGTPEAPEAAHYKFLKVLTQVLTGLGMQLCSLWGKDESSGQPPNLAMYLEVILTFSSHPSLTMTNYVNQLWSAMFRHEQMSRHPVFLEFVPKWVNATAPKIIKPSYRSSLPANGIADAAYYASLDYDCKEEFHTFFISCRTALLDTFRQATFVAPLVTFAYVQRWLQQRIQQSRADETPCTLQSPANLEWEALACILDSVLSKILQVNERPPRTAGLQLLELCLNFVSKDPLILSQRLSCISALFVFLTMAPSTALLTQVLNTIFSALIYAEPGVAKENWSRAARDVRRHAANLMVKICLKYPLILLPIFDQIHATMCGLQKDEQQLTKTEKVTLKESLLLINNHFYDYERQTNFIGEELKSASILWHLLGQKVFSSAQAFMNAVGLDRSAAETSVDEVCGDNRANIQFCVQLMVATVKRCTWPDDPDKAARGGFVVRVTESGNPIYRNPAEPHVIPMLPHLLALLRTFNAMWKPESRSLLAEDFKTAHNLSETERSVLLGTGTAASNGISDPGNPVDPSDLSLNNGIMKVPTPLLRMQTFLTNVYDFSYHVLGGIGPSLGWGLYQLPGLASNIINTVFSNLEHVPDFRMRMVVKTFIRPFISSCPSALYEQVLMPMLTHFCPYILERLTAKWQFLTDLREAGGIDDENPDAQEVIDDIFNRLLTREYLEVVKVALIGGSIAADPVNNAIDSMDQDDAKFPLPAQNNVEVASELGQLILRNSITAEAVTLTVLRALAWNDSMSNLKACLLTGPLVRQLISDGSMSGPLAAHVMTSLLQGLQLHGQHEVNQAALIILGAQLYDLLRPRFSEVLEVMKQIPGVNLTELQKLDEKVLGSVAAAPGANSASRGSSKLDKAKKDNFKRLTTQLVGCNISQLFRKKAAIAELPRIQVPKKPKPTLDDIPNVDIALTSLFTQPKAS